MLIVKVSCWLDLKGEWIMTYTVKMDIFIDDDNIIEDYALKEALQEMMNMVTISDFKVLTASSFFDKITERS